ncbi:cytochrome b-c1 complex subunit 2, mitochondrial-like [Oppia nitens]|uniref:cytochrome b-c1 complex subunit 2, mitochondrial-like n=1 Tax=Oppia nitens TaxID=1686743 RepID=UPI0023DAC1D1|nr:cytochrome b-c1 complex subunit 2, mitochondrial-like [Oppia nitens]
MMASKLRRNPLNGLIVKRLLSGQTAAAKSSEAAEAVKSAQLKTTTLPNGLVVTSLETFSPVAQIGVILRAGSRYEPQDKLGLSHTLRSMAGFTTENHTVFGITRNIEYVGGSLTAHTTRDDIVYILENDRTYTDLNIKYLAETITKPAFKRWQIKDNCGRQRVDLSHFKDQPNLVVMEALHSVAFRGGLRNSLYSPDFMIGKHTTEDLHNYVEQHFVSNRAAVVGLGIDHKHLLELVEKHLPLARSDRGNSGQSKFIGGETRIDSNSNTTYVAIATEGVGAKNQKEMICLELLQIILGTGPNISYQDGSHTKLGAAVAKATSEPFAVSAFNMSYSDTGLFGINIAASAKDIHKAVKAAVTQLRDTAKNISAEELKNAKNNLKASLFLSCDDYNYMIEEIGTESLNYGSVLSLPEFQKALDSVTVQDVTGLATKIVKTKGAMASYGNLQNAPFLEDLI